jgi:hypothetical protein
MNIQENIQRQINAGFSKHEIIENLKQQGHTEEEIANHSTSLDGMGATDGIGLEEPAKKENSGKNIITGIIFLVLGLTRLLGIRGGSSGLSIILGIGLVIVGIVSIVQGIKKR